MPPLYSRGTREALAKRQKDKNNLPRSLHRGLHLNEYTESAATFKANTSKERADHRDLLVHHQKINDSLQDLYSRTAALHKEDATMEERIEESWRQFERIGGRRPTNVRTRQEGSSLCVSQTAIPYAQRLAEVSQEKKRLRQRAETERETRGEVVDYSEGSALHALKDKRVRLFQRRQLKRAHLLRRVGDPTPLKQSGRYDMSAGTLQVFNKTIRKVKREVAADAKVMQVRERRRGQRSQWDVEAHDLNQSSGVLRESREWNLGPRQKRRRKERTQKTLRLKHFDLSLSLSLGVQGSVGGCRAVAGAAAHLCFALLPRHFFLYVITVRTVVRILLHTLSIVTAFLIIDLPICFADAMTGLVNMEVSFATFLDEKLPPAALTNPRAQKACAVTTGGFPHELVLTTAAASAKIQRVVLRFNEAKNIELERRNEDGSYQMLHSCVLEKDGQSEAAQEVVVALDPEGVGKDIHELRLRILSGYSEFVGIYRVDVFGEESQQKFVVFEKKAEITM
eukprot:gene12035-8288_t